MSRKTIIYKVQRFRCDQSTKVEIRRTKFLSFISHNLLALLIGINNFSFLIDKNHVRRLLCKRSEFLLGFSQSILSLFAFCNVLSNSGYTGNLMGLATDQHAAIPYPPNRPVWAYDAKLLGVFAGFT